MRARYTTSLLYLIAFDTLKGVIIAITTNIYYNECANLLKTILYRQGCRKHSSTQAMLIKPQDDIENGVVNLNSYLLMLLILRFHYIRCINLIEQKLEQFL